MTQVLPAVSFYVEQKAARWGSLATGRSLSGRKKRPTLQASPRLRGLAGDFPPASRDWLSRENPPRPADRGVVRGEVSLSITPKRPGVGGTTTRVSEITARAVVLTGAGEAAGGWAPVISLKGCASSRVGRTTARELARPVERYEDDARMSNA